MPRSDDRFARQIRGELPPEFPLASPCPSIDHHLSGTSTYAPAANELNRPRPHCSIVQQNCRSCVCNFSISLRRWVSLKISRERENGSQRLAYVLDSLVSVSRRFRSNAVQLRPRLAGPACSY